MSKWIIQSVDFGERFEITNGIRLYKSNDESEAKWFCETLNSLEWKSIESAPKDGTIILLGGGTWADDELEEAPRVMTARWYGDASVGYFWNVCCAEGGCSIFPYNNPTHWLPLPPPPKEQEDVG